MERSRFRVRPSAFEEIHELPNAWQLADFRAILTALDFDDVDAIADGELREMCAMALADLEPDDAAAVVVRHRLGKKLRSGQIEDVAHDMIEEPLWEDYPDMSTHEQLYNANQLLYDAFNGKFPRPRAVQIELEVEALDPDGERMMSPPSEAVLVRLLAAGLDEDARVHRLFEDQLAGTRFPEAEFIVWQLAHRALDRRRALVSMIGSGYWLAGLEDVEAFESTAHEDIAAKAEN